MRKFKRALQNCRRSSDATDMVIFAADKIAVIGLVIAVYGAALSTFVQWNASRKDRVRIRMKIQPNMVAPDAPQTNVAYTIISATNIGKRPVNIIDFGAVVLDSRTGHTFEDIRPKPPCELTKGQYAAAFVNQQ